MSKIVRLTEGDLHRIIKNSALRILKEEEGRNIKGNGVDKLSDSELIRRYKLEKKFLKGDFTDEEVYDLGFTVAERKKYDNGNSAVKNKMIDKRVGQIAKLRFRKYKDALKERGLIKPKSPSKETNEPTVVPNMNANFGTFAGKTGRKVIKSHSNEEIQRAKELLPPLMETAKQLYNKYGAYDTTNRFNEIFTNLNLAMYEFTGEEDNYVPSTPIQNKVVPTADEAKSEIDRFRMNYVYPAYMELKTQHLKNCLASITHAATEISKVLSGKEVSSFDIHKAHQKKMIDAKRAAADVDRKRLKVNDVDGILGL